MIKQKVMKQLKLAAVKSIQPKVDGMPFLLPYTENRVADVDGDAVVLKKGETYYLILEPFSSKGISGVEIAVNPVGDLKMLGMVGDIRVEPPKEKDADLNSLLVLTAAHDLLLEVGKTILGVVIIAYDSDHEDEVVFEGKKLDGTKVTEEKVPSSEEDIAVLNAFDKASKEQHQ